MPAEIWPMFVWSLQQILCVVPMHFNTTFSSAPHRGAHSVEDSWFHSISRQAFSTRCNASKSFICAEFTKVFSCLHSQKSRKLRSGDRAGQLAGPPRPIHCSPKVWFRCGPSLQGVPHHAWTACVVVDEETHVTRLPVNHSQKLDGTVHLLVSQARQLVLSADYLRCPSRHWWKIYVDILLPRWCGNYHPSTQEYYESSQYRPLWIPPHKLAGY
jgi:hypothetical protein